MAIKTATIRVVNRVCQKMVKIDHHRQYHHQPGLPPALLEESPCDPKWNKKMKTKVNDSMAHLKTEKNSEGGD